MANSNMKWSRGDYIKLGIYVNKYNNKINELGNLSYLPKRLEYQNLKSRILSRQEYNRNLEELKGFLQEGAEEKIQLKSGELITKWEKEKLNREIKIAKSRLTKEMKELEKPYKSAYSKAQMGYEEYRNILTQLRDIGDLENRRGDSFARLKDRISRIGILDYKMLKATVYRENFMESLKIYENMRGYDILNKKLSSIKNSIKFFEYIEKSDVFSDLFVYYQDNDKNNYGNFESVQDRFNYGIEELGLFEEEKQKEIKKLKKKGKNEDVKKLENIDNFLQFLEFTER